MTTDDIIADAEVAALFLRTLIAQGVPLATAVDITCRYIQGVQLGRFAQAVDATRPKLPREPWEGGA